MGTCNQGKRRVIGGASRPRSGGFTLVEALVAMLALSIGLLGVAGLQLTGVRANQSASWRSQATYLSYDILERMRLNSINRAAYVIDLEEEVDVETSTTASQDVTDWKQNLAATLPNGDGSVELDPDDDFVAIITVQWSDARGDSVTSDEDAEEEEVPLQFTMRSRL